MGQKESGTSDMTVLTNRQYEVLALTAQGLTNQEIAGNLNISIKTVEYHFTEIYSIFGLSGHPSPRVSAVIKFQSLNSNKTTRP